LFDAAGKVFEALKTGAWEVAFLAIDPARASNIAFTAPYVLIEGTYLVPAGSPLQTIEDMDCNDVRIAVARNAAYDLFLTRTLKHAQIVHAPSPSGALELFLSERLDAVAGVKQALMEAAAAHQGLRVMEGRFMAIEQATGTPKGREVGARYLRVFVEEVKASGFVAEALERSGQNATIAPASRS